MGETKRSTIDRVKPITAVAEEILTRLDERGNDGVWISKVGEEALLKRAAGLDAAADLPLRGVPFAVKDNIDVAGVPTTVGCRAFAYTPERSAPEMLY